jgi:hypothetical protein
MLKSFTKSERYLSRVTLSTSYFSIIITEICSMLFPSLMSIRTSLPVLFRVNESPEEGLKTNPFSLSAIFPLISMTINFSYKNILYKYHSPKKFNETGNRISISVNYISEKFPDLKELFYSLSLCDNTTGADLIMINEYWIFPNIGYFVTHYPGIVRQ